MATVWVSDAMSIPIPRMAPPRDGTLPGPRSRRPRSSLFMRGLRRGIPFEPRTPVEGADLTHEDLASSRPRRPSPEITRPLTLPTWQARRRPVFGETHEWGSYKPPRTGREITRWGAAGWGARAG